MSFNDGPRFGPPGRGGMGPRGAGGSAQPARSLRERLVTGWHICRLTSQVWRTSPVLTIITVVLRLLRALQPVAALYAGKLIIDEVVRQLGAPPPGPELSDWMASDRLTHLAQYLGFELALVVANDILTRGT